MREGMLHIRDVEGQEDRSMEARLEAMEQQVFKCQGMVERGLNANYMMITEFTNKHKIDDNDNGKHLSRLYDRIDHLQAQIYDMQNQNYHVTRKFGKLQVIPIEESKETMRKLHRFSRRNNQDILDWANKHHQHEWVPTCASR
ncbi:40S ribosomal protein S5-1 [Hordeum vulgare]|nr:40S ribosomal protein S5-1 [Hordeum vulgare]